MKREEQSGRLSGQSLVVDYALNAQSWGAVGLRATTIEGLAEAMQQALKEEASTVIHCLVAPKSMTGNYEGWWRVGTAEVSSRKEVVEAWKTLQVEREKVRQF